MNEEELEEELSLDLIDTSPHQPRLDFDLEELRGSIKKDGIIVPITVRQIGKRYELIDGERRVRIARDEGYKTIPYTLKDADDETADRMGWTLNTVQKDYKPKEKAFHFKKHQDEGMTTIGIAKIHNESPKTITAYLKVFQLPEKYQKLIWAKEIGIGVVHEILPLLNGGGISTNTPPQAIEILGRAATEKHFGQKEAREIMNPLLEERDEKIREEGEKLAETFEPDVKIETSEDYERAAQSLKKKAKELKSPEQIREEKKESARKYIESYPSFEKSEKLGVDISRYKKELNKIEALIEKDPEDALKQSKALRKEYVAERKKCQEEKQREKLRKEERKKLLKDSEFIKRAALAADIMAETPKDVGGITISDDEAIEMAKSFKEGQEEFEERMKDPKVQKIRKKYKNWSAHNAIYPYIEGEWLTCPYCGKDAEEHLVWKCKPDKTMKEAKDKASKDFDQKNR